MGQLNFRKTSTESLLYKGRFAVCCLSLLFLAACEGNGTRVVDDNRASQNVSLVASDESTGILLDQQPVSDENRSQPSESASGSQPVEILPEEILTVESLPEANLPEASLLEESQLEESQLETSVEQQVAETSFTATVGAITDLILVTGQSNALGAGTSFDELLDAPHSQVMAYTNEGWRIADLHQIWDLNWFPRNDPNTPPSNNFSLHFGKRVVTRAPDRVVGFILMSAPGSPISHWDVDGEFFNEIRNEVSQAINELPFKSKLDGILWHQGESDGEDRDEYGNALYDLITRFRSEPWFSDDLPFICGDTARSPVNNQLRRLNSDADPWTACVEAQGLPVVPETDHFNAESLRTIGGRYADAYLEMYLGIR